MDHPSLETMARLLASDLSHEELLREVIPHLLDCCPECRRQGDEILRLQKESGHWDERVALHEWRQAPELLTLLENRSIDEQLTLVTDDETFQTWGFCQLLLKESLKAAFEDAERAINLAELAIRISQTLDEAYDLDWVLDLRARAYAYLGNSQRVLGELRSAEAAFREAENLLAQSSTGNDLARAEVIYLKSSLLRAQRRLGEAMALVEQALALYQEQDDAEGMGNAFLKKAKILEEQGNIPGAIEALRRSIGLAVPHSRLDLYARHNLVLCLAQAGRYEEADRFLAEIRETFARGGQPLDLLRLRWAEGKVALGMGRLPDAETALREVQEELLARSMGYDAALVSLDLAVLFARERRTDDLKRLASEMLQVFESRDVHREAVAALLLFQNACEEERLSVELAGQLAAILQRERRSK